MYGAVGLYNTGYSLKEIAEILGYSSVGIWKFLKRHNVKIRPVGIRRRLSLDESVFESINPDSAYWIGFLLADGNVYCKDKNQRTISLNLSFTDIFQVEKFRSFMKSGHKIHIFKNKPTNRYTAKLAFHSKKIAKDLNMWGVTPKKSFTAKVHPNLKDNRDFWRGVFDGDGCISTSKQGFTVMVLYGTKFIISDFTDFLDSYSIRHGKMLVRKGLYSTQVCNKVGVSKLHDILYNNAKTYLERKCKYFD